MIRVLATIVLPLLLPTLIYVLWLKAAQRTPLASSAVWRALPWPWLLGTGIVLAALTLYAIGARLGGSPEGQYVPPQWVGGKIVPGHIEPPAQR